MPNRKPVIIHRSRHTVSRKDIDPDALSVMRHLNRSGHKAYLVGGGVRDLLLGHKPKDFDISTDAEPGRIRRLFRNCHLVGRRFRLAHIRFGRDKIIETSTFRRAPDPAPDGEPLVQWDDNAFGSPEEDARRRDLTINAIFYDLSDFSLIDHVGGLHDLRRGLIRSIGDPNIRFQEDPVRMVRAVRFAARFGFRIETATRKAILTHHAHIGHASPARMLEELYKLFAFHAAEASFFLLWELKLLGDLLPELEAYLKAAGGQDAPLWRHLAALDSGEHWPGIPEPALLLGTLFCDPVMQMLAASGKAGDPLPDAARIDRYLSPFVSRFKVPKSVRYSMIRMLEHQPRMDAIAGARRASSGRWTRMLRQERFAESLALLEIRAASGTAEPETLCHWKQAFAQSSATAHPSSPSTDGETRPPRKRRRRPRRKKAVHDPADS